MPDALRHQLSLDVWRSLRCEWLWVYRGEPKRTQVWSAEIPVPPGVFFVEQGEARIRAYGQEHSIARGSAFFTAPGHRQQWFATGTRLLSVGFRADWPDGTPLHRTGLNLVASVPGLRRATLQLYRQIHGSRKAIDYQESVLPHPLDPMAWAQREPRFTLGSSCFWTPCRNAASLPNCGPEAASALWINSSRGSIHSHSIIPAPRCPTVFRWVSAAPTNFCNSRLASACARSSNDGGSTRPGPGCWGKPSPSRNSPLPSASGTPPTSPPGFGAMPACRPRRIGPAVRPTQLKAVGRKQDEPRRHKEHKVATP